MTSSSGIEEALTAIERGDYSQCLSYLEPLSHKHPFNTQVGAKIRMLMITAWMGQGEEKKAIATCRLLTKIKDPEIRQEAKQLISILEAPDLPRPENWSIQIPSINLESSDWSNNITSNRDKQKKDSPSHPPTGPTKAFDLGFSSFFFVIIILLTIFFAN